MAWDLESQQKLDQLILEFKHIKTEVENTRKIVGNKENLQEDTYTHLQSQLEH